MSHRCISGEEFVIEVLKALSDAELRALTYKMRGKEGWIDYNNIPNARSKVQSMGPKGLRKALHLIATGNFGNPLYPQVLSLMPQVKRRLADVKVPSAWLSTDTRDLFPQSTFNHPSLGPVILSTHAFTRFLERYRNQHLTTSDPLTNATRARAKLEEFFSEAKEAPLSNPVIRVKRLLSNGCKPARYFYHQHTNLRFVVNEEKPPTLMTVEDAFKDRD